eukprot:9207440-Pyramimonas_sp.AAC.1
MWAVCVLVEHVQHFLEVVLHQGDHQRDNSVSNLGKPTCSHKGNMRATWRRGTQVEKCMLNMLNRTLSQLRTHLGCRQDAIAVF